MLISLNQQQAIKPISPNWAASVKISGGVTNFVQLANEVEKFELSNLLGLDFYTDLTNNYTLEKYQNLLNGVTFENRRGNNVSFNGLIYILAYLNFAKYSGISFINDTFTGMVRKSRDESENISQGDIKRIQTDCRQIAMNDFSIIVEFMEINNTIYDLWNRKRSNNTYIPKIFGIKKTLT